LINLPPFGAAFKLLKKEGVINSMTTKEKILSDTIYNGLDSFAVGIIGYLFWILMAKLLSVADYGILMTALTLYGFLVSIFTFNIGEVFGKLIPQTPREKLAELYGYPLKFIIPFSAAGILVLLLLSYSEFLNPEFSASLFYSLILLIPGIVYTFLRGILYGNAQFKKIFYIELLAHTFKIIAAVLLVYLGFAIGGIAGWFIALLTGAALFYMLLRPKLSFSKSSEEVKSNMKSSIINVISGFLISNVAIVYLGFVDIKSAALFGALFVFGQILSLFPGVIQGAAFPSLSYFVKNSREKLEKLVRRVFKYYLIIIVPLLLSFTLLAKQFILLMYKIDYLPVAMYMLPYALSISLNLFSGIMLAVVYSSGRQHERNKVVMITACFATLAYLILITYFAIAGAVFASLLSSVLLFAISLKLLGRIVPLKIPPRAAVKFICLSLIILVALYMISFFDDRIVWISLLCLTCILYAFLLYATRLLDAEDLYLIKLSMDKVKKHI